MQFCFERNEGGRGGSGTCPPSWIRHCKGCIKVSPCLLYHESVNIHGATGEGTNTGLDHWTTGIDYWTGIFLVFNFNFYIPEYRVGVCCCMCKNVTLRNAYLVHSPPKHPIADYLHLLYFVWEDQKCCIFQIAA